MPRFGLVIFDMDGTITAPFLDFKKLRLQLHEALCGEFQFPADEPLLERIMSLQGEPRRVAFEILESAENRAAAESTLNPGVHDVLSELRRRRVPAALLTRNRRSATECVMSKHALRFDFVATRDDGPIKPDPRAVLRISDHFCVASEMTLVVGDYKYDIQVGRNAGARTCLITHGNAPEFVHAADYVIERLPQLLELV